MINLKLKTIASLIEKDDIVLDVGTDHAFLPIYLMKNNLCKKVIASDISENALKSAKENISKAKLKISLYLSDGIKNIKEKYNTLVIAGMGTNTIIDILKNQQLPNKIILSSNNHLDVLRKYMNEINYKIINEVVVKDKNKYYDIIVYQKGNELLSKSEILYGKAKNKDYLNYLYQTKKEIYKKVNFPEKVKLFKQLWILKKLIKQKK